MIKKIIFLILCCLPLGKTVFVLAEETVGNLTEALESFNALNGGQKDAIFSSLGMPDVSGFSWVKLMGSFIFSGIGVAVFIYGKKERSFKPLLIGAVLVGYSYFITNTFWMYAVGIGLCLLLYFWRD